MFQTLCYLLPLLQLALSAPAPASSPNAVNLKPIDISAFTFHPSSVRFTYNDPNTKVKTTCFASSIPTAYTACANPNVQFKFRAGDKSNDFHISLKETRSTSSAYIVDLASTEVTKSPKSFSVPVRNVYTFKPYQLPLISTFQPSGRPGSSPFGTLNFTVTDPNGNGAATTNCSTQFILEPSADEVTCVNPSFTFRVTDYKGVGQFTLVVDHTYPLKKGAAKPKITTEGTLVVDNQAEDPNYTCSFGGSGVGSCGIAEGKAPLKAPIRSVAGF